MKSARRAEEDSAQRGSSTIAAFFAAIIALLAATFGLQHALIATTSQPTAAAQSTTQQFQDLSSQASPNSTSSSGPQSTQPVQQDQASSSQASPSPASSTNSTTAGTPQPPPNNVESAAVVAAVPPSNATTQPLATGNFSGTSSAGELARLQILGDQLQSDIASLPQSDLLASSVITVPGWAASQRINQLSDVTISNSTIDAASIPDLSGSYLSLDGGALTGGLSIAGDATTTGNAYFASSLEVGTTSPTDQMVLAHDDGATFSTNNAQLLVEHSYSGAYPYAGIQIDHHNSGAGNQGGADLIFSDNLVKEGLLRFDSANGVTDGLGLVNVTNDGPIYFETNDSGGGYSAPQLLISSAGNVGIGTTTPWAQLSINPNGISGPAFVVGSSTATDFIVTNGGNVAIGTSTSYSALTIQGTSGLTFYNSLGAQQGTISPGASTADHQLMFNLIATTSANDAFDNWAIFRFDGSQNKIQLGHTGTGGWIESGGSSLNFANAINSTANPAMTIAGSDVGVATLAAGTSNSLCYNTSAIAGMNTLSTCSSDQRLKENITLLDASTTLAQVMELNPVSFNWNPQFASSSPEQFGLIAQQVQQVWPNLVSTTSPTALTPDGTLSINFNDLWGPVFAAIQALDQQLADLANNIAGFADSFTSKEITATNELCVGDGSNDPSPVCITKSQLAAILTAAGIQTSPESVTSSPTTTNPESVTSPGTGESATTDTPPIIQITGDNPATVQVGATYTDLGVQITGPQQDLNLDIDVIVDGGATTTPDQIQIDTPAPATDTIEYVATDQNGIEGIATRTVIVSAPAQSDGIASSTDATSTDATGAGDTSTTSAAATITASSTTP